MFPFPRKSPYSLPAEEYGGGRKRIFIGLLAGSCALLCLLLALCWIVPALGFDSIHPWLGDIAGACCAAVVLGLSWLCAALIWHVFTGRPVWGGARLRGLVIRALYPLMELLGCALGLERSRIRHSFIKVNNEMVLASGVRTAPERLLLLLPHCLQRSRCPHRLSPDNIRCVRCGGCPVGELLRLRDACGFRMVVATGGTIARRIAAQMRPQVIVAVACERDLTSGIQDSYPLPVFGILNERPHGPCVDTQVSLARVEAAVRYFTGLEPVRSHSGGGRHAK